MKRLVFLERRSPLTPIAIGAAFVTTFVGMFFVGVNSAIQDEVERRVGRARIVCPLYEDGDPLVNSTQHPDGSVTCRYSVSRDFMRQKLNRPNPRKAT